MELLGLVWLGCRTAHYDKMRNFVADVLDLDIAMEQEDAVVFSFPNGDAFEVFKPTDTEHSHFEHPVVGFLVADVRAAREKLERRGVEFVGEVHRGVPVLRARGAQDKVKLIGLYMTPGVYEGIKANAIEASYLEPAVLIGRASIHQAARILEDKDFVRTFVPVGKFYDQSNIDELDPNEAFAPKDHRPVFNVR